jgi:hypothetical protein
MGVRPPLTIAMSVLFGMRFSREHGWSGVPSTCAQDRVWHRVCHNHLQKEAGPQPGKHEKLREALSKSRVYQPSKTSGNQWLALQKSVVS